MNSTHSRTAAFAATVLILLLAAACAPLAPVAELDEAAFDRARRLAGLVSEPGLRELLGHFDSPRCLYLDADGVEEARAFIEARLASYGYPASDLSQDTVTIEGIVVADGAGGGYTVPGTFTMKNLVLTKRGTDPGLAPVLVGAHYDTVANCPGVDDNGTGCSAVLECARILAGESFERTIVFAFWGMHEPGLYGSSLYAGSLPEPGLPAAVINVDQVGVTSARQKRVPFVDFPEEGDFIMAASASDPLSRRLVDDFLLVAGRLEIGLRVAGVNADAGAGSSFVGSNLMRSDHVPFAKRGVPALFVSDTADARDREPFYHLAEDTEANIDYAFYRDVVAAVLGTLVVEAERR